MKIHAIISSGILGGLLLFAACSNKPIHISDSPVSEQTEAPHDLTRTPLHFITPLLQPTMTDPSSLSETPSQPKTQEFSVTPSVTPTQDSYLQIAFSPDGKLVAKVYERYGEEKQQTILITTKDGAVIWEIPTQLDPPSGDPHPTMAIYGWSNDGSRLYFYYALYPDGGDWAFWWDGFNLQSFDIETGLKEEFFFRDVINLMAFAISPDNTEIAYTQISDNPFILRIRDLHNGTERNITVQNAKDNYVRVGNISWSPSGSGLVFHTEDEDYWVQTVYLDTTTMTTEIIYEGEIYSFFMEGWFDENTLRFSDYKEIFTIDIESNKVKILGTPTPMP